MMVPVTEQILDVQISCLEISRDFLTSDRRGAMAKLDEESNKERPPGTMERTHVRPGEVAKLNLGSLIILSGVDLESIGLVFFEPVVLNAQGIRSEKKIL